jgi:hypothetical protein
MCSGLAIGAEILPPEPFTGPVLATVHHRAADARLIAAAPDLLKALKESLPALERQLEYELEHCPCEDGDCSDCEAHIEVVRRRNAAITKAEGR